MKDLEIRVTDMTDFLDYMKARFSSAQSTKAENLKAIYAILKKDLLNTGELCRKFVDVINNNTFVDSEVYGIIQSRVYKKRNATYSYSGRQLNHGIRYSLRGIFMVYVDDFLFEKYSDMFAYFD